MRLGALGVATAQGLAALAPPARAEGADNASVQELRRQLDEMRRRDEQMRRRVEQLEALVRGACASCPARAAATSRTPAQADVQAAQTAAHEGLGHPDHGLANRILFATVARF